MDGLRSNRAARVYISLSRSPSFSLPEEGKREREREGRQVGKRHVSSTKKKKKTKASDAFSAARCCGFK